MACALLVCGAAVLSPLAARAQATSAAPTNSTKRAVTLESVFGAGGILGEEPDAVTWLPDGKRLSYIHTRADGKPELWTIDAATGERSILVGSEKLLAMTAPVSNIEDAVERERRTRYGVTGYHWSPDAQHILFDANGSLHYFDLAAGQPKKLETPHPAIDPKFSPDGHLVSYVLDHNLQVRALRDNVEHVVAQDGTAGNAAGDILNGEVDWLYEEELGVRSNYFWSPDSKRLAFLQTDLRRVPTHPVTDYIPTHATAIMEKYPLVGDPLPSVRLGIAGATGGKVHWIDLNTNDAYVPRFGWINSETLYALVLNRQQQKVDLYFIDQKSGKSKCVLSESSDAYIDVETHLQFYALRPGNRFLWLSWRGGFTHIYLYSFDSAHPLDREARLERQLTEGNFEVAGIVGVNEDAGSVFYLANKEDDREQDLYRVALDGSGSRRLTTDAGYSTAAFNYQGAAYVKTYSRADRPTERSLCQVGSECRVVDAPSTATDSYDVRPPEFVDFAAEDGTVLHGMLFLPPHENGKVPLVLAPYGGPGGQMVQNRWLALDLFDLVLANHGIAVLVVDNRGSANRGQKFTGAIRLRMGEVELKDQMAALDQALARYPQLDSSRLGFWGWSYGGFMTLYAMTHSDRFVAGAAGSPVSDWRLYDATYSERFMGLLPEHLQGYEEYSVLRHAKDLKGHLLMTHGLSDVNVHPQNTVKMADELIRADIPFDMMMYPRQTHHFTDAAELHVFQKFVEHLEKYLLVKN